MSVKALITYVLDEVAIAGEHGTPIQGVFQHVNEFYINVRQERYNIGDLIRKAQVPGLASPKDKVTEIDAEQSCQIPEYWGLPNVNEEFQEYIWNLLVQDDDFKVGIKNEFKDLTLKEVVEKLKNGGDKENDVLKVYVTEDRRWRALAGHGVNFKKVPLAVFKCLEVIAAHREQGLLQPELTKITGQDKKSIAGRTTYLKNMGYIEKAHVLTRSMNTSRLTLTKFAVMRDQKLKKLSKSDRQSQNTASIRIEKWTGETIDTEGLIKAIITELKAVKNGVLQRNDLKKKMGMDKSRFHWRALSRILRNVEMLGIWRRIRVPLPGKERRHEKNGAPTACHANCLRFIRDITRDDWRKLEISLKLNVEYDDDADDLFDAEEGKDGKSAEDVDLEAINEHISRVNVDVIEDEHREPPIWIPDIALPNLIFSLVNGAGKDGISSMDIVHRIAGGFYYRPMDQIMHRITDFPSKSQPPEYTSFAIIRETNITHRQTHYHYFSYEAHQELVKEGLAVESWASKDKKKGVKTGSRAEETVDIHIPEFDEYGFPVTISNRLLHGDGTATLAESQKLGKVKENSASYKCLPGWRKGFRTTGRPRKYEKGKEPYLEGKRRREARLAALALAAAAETGQDGGSTQEASNKRAFEEIQDGAPLTPSSSGRPSKLQKTDGNSSVPKRRGRPPKIRPPVSVDLEAPLATPENKLVLEDQPPSDKPPSGNHNLPTDGSSHVPKRRGRPPKICPPVFEASLLIQDTGLMLEGRTPLDQPPSGNLDTPADNYPHIPKRRGRPPKNRPPVFTEPVVFQAAQKNRLMLEDQTPSENPNLPADGSPRIPKRRGRPPKNPPRVAEPIAFQATDDNAQKVVPQIPLKNQSKSAPIPKRRGRPPKNPRKQNPASTEIPAAETSTETGHKIEIDSALERRSTPEVDISFISRLGEDLPKDDLQSGECELPNDIVQTKEMRQPTATLDLPMASLDHEPFPHSRKNPSLPILELTDTQNTGDVTIGKFSRKRKASTSPEDVTEKRVKQDGQTQQEAKISLVAIVAPGKSVTGEPTPDKRMLDDPVTNKSATVSETRLSSTALEEPVTKSDIIGEVLSSPKQPNTSEFETSQVKDNAVVSESADDATALPEQASTFLVDGISIEEGKFDNEADSYGSLGGMLAIGRQQVVLDLLADNNGIFPGGNELHHAFSINYKKKNPKAGVADRRLVRGIVQSLQYKGKINQFTFSFMSGRGTMVTKKLLVDCKIPVESPIVIKAIRGIRESDGNLWFPPNTALPDGIKERMSTPTFPRLQFRPTVVEEGVEFERIFQSSEEELKKKKREETIIARAAKAAKKEEDKRIRQEMRAMKRNGVISHWTGKFTDEQREEARQRKAELKSKIHRLRNKFHDINDSVIDEDNPHTKTIWWDDFVHRTDEKSFLKDVKDVRKWELLMGQDDSLLKPSKEDGLVMINHFGPEIATGQTHALIDSQIKALPTPRSWVNKPLSVHRTQANKLAGDKEKGANITPVIKRRRRRAKPKDPSRREQAMTAIYQTTAVEKYQDEQEVHAKKDWSHRNKYAIPKEDEDILLIAVIIVRTIFGHVDRKINWNLVQTSVPQHPAIVFQRRWPRVRDTHKTHLKKLQSQFEEMYLEAYAKGQLPPIDLEDPMSFDLPYHVKWFRENLELPEAHTVPELSSDREVFENLYNLVPEKASTWRADFHNPNFTMGSRANHFVCYAYELPLEPETGPGETIGVIDFVKSIIKSNIVTDVTNYNPAAAFALIRAQPEDAVDEAFFELTNNKVIMHSKELGRAVPGRNYELTDRFHASLNTPMDQKLFGQAILFERSVKPLFAENKSVELSPFLNDGTAACVFNLVAHRRVRLSKLEYKAYPMGLLDGYETRSMPKSLVDFKVLMTPQPTYFDQPEMGTIPVIPDGKSENPIEPIRLWYDMNGNVVKGMWFKVVTSVLAVITGRPGIDTRELTRAFHPGVNFYEVCEVVRWLAGRGAIDCFGGNTGCWAREGFYRALEGL